MSDPYNVLGVERIASPEDIRRAYRTLTQIFHPDRYEEMPAAVRDTAKIRMQEVNEAYRILRTPGGSRPPTSSPESHDATADRSRQQQQRLDDSDRQLLRALGEANDLAALIHVLQQAQAVDLFHTKKTPLGWQRTLQERWAYFTANGALGERTHDVVTCPDAAWEYSKKALYLVPGRVSVRRPAWCVPDGGRYFLKEGNDLVTTDRGPLDTWVDADGRTMARMHLFRHRGSKREHDRSFDPDYFGGSNAGPGEPPFYPPSREVQRKPVGALVLAVEPGHDPMVRNEKKWGLQGRSLGWDNTIMLTEKHEYRRTRQWFDLGSSMLAFALAKDRECMGADVPSHRI